MNDVTFSKYLSSVMLDNRYDRFVKNRRTGKLDTRSLFKIETSSKLFKKREARKNKEYAVSLVVDCSGSMGGEKIQMAARSAKKLSHHLAKIGINHNVVTFNSYAGEVKPFSIREKDTLEADIVGEVQSSYLDEKSGDWESASDRRTWFVWDRYKTVQNKEARTMFGFVGMYRGRDEINENQRRLDVEARSRGMNFWEAYWTCDGPSYNADAEALIYARKQLLKQKGSRIMIFLSDGQPAPLHSDVESPIHPGTHQREYDVRKEVANTLRTGIELYSVGIMDGSVKEYYPPRRTAAIRTIDQLYPHVIKLIKLNLKRG